MAINKNFVIKHGVEVSGDLIYANPDIDRVGVGTTTALHTLHVNGGIGATNLNVSGIATFTTLVATSATISSLTISTVPSTVAFTTITADEIDPLNLDLTGSTITIGGTTGLNGQYLISTGTGVNWISTPTARTSTTIIAAPAQTSISYTYTVGLVDVYINGVKLSTSEFTANDGVSITLNDACFGGETIEIIAYAVSSLGAGTSGIQGLTIQNQGITTGNPLSITSLNFVGASVTAVNSGLGITVYISDNNDTTYSASAGIATYASTAGIATYASSSGISTYSETSGISTYSSIAGIATYASSSGISTYSQTSGISTYSSTSGISSYSDVAGISTYSQTSGISSSLTSTANINTSGIITATGGFIGVANTSPVIIDVVGNQLIFNVVGIGSTTLTLF